MTKKEIDSLRIDLQGRLSLEKICNEHYFIQHMNPKLQLPFSVFLNDPALRQRKISSQKLIKILDSIDILQRMTNHAKGLVYRLDYPRSQTVVLVTGITIDFVAKLLRELQKHCCQLVGKVKQPNQFWIAVEMGTAYMALEFKKLARGRKRICDNQLDMQYKVERKRVRIVIQNQDLFTILVDAMSDQLNNRFLQKFGKENSAGITYQKLEFKQPLLDNSNPKTDQQFYQDNLSEDRSRTTEGFDGRSINDLVEHRDQGIQAQKIEQNIIAAIGQKLQLPQVMVDTDLKQENDEKEKHQWKSQVETREEVSPADRKTNKMGEVESKSSTEITFSESANKNQTSFDHFQDKGHDNAELNGKKSARKKKKIKQIVQVQTLSPKQRSSTPEKTALSPQKFANITFEHNESLKKGEVSRQPRYEYIQMQRLFYQHQKSRNLTKNRDAIIPQYLAKEEDSLMYKKRFLDTWLEHARYYKRRDARRDYF